MYTLLLNNSKARADYRALFCQWNNEPFVGNPGLDVARPDCQAALAVG